MRARAKRKNVASDRARRESFASETLFGFLYNLYIIEKMMVIVIKEKII